ncbi:MAG: hypothetical protein KME31_01725 [Tolypothrix carrinoi HA7290-LM1]|nr:hypothetical protein [Tolypothrix carrinoi HA7290-LM1]
MRHQGERASPYTTIPKICDRFKAGAPRHRTTGSVNKTHALIARSLYTFGRLPRSKAFDDQGFCRISIILAIAL